MIKGGGEMAHCDICGEDYGWFHINSECKCKRNKYAASVEDQNFNNGVDMRGCY